MSKNCTAKPRGMAIAKKTAQKVHESGGSVKNCPYKSKSWRSVFCKEMQRLEQMELLS